MASEAPLYGWAFKMLWPLIPAFGVGLVGYGVLSQDVAHIKTQQDEATKTAATDHDSLTRIDERQKTMSTDLTEIKDTVKDIQKTLK